MVVDRDVNELPAGLAPANAGRVGSGAVVVTEPADAMARASLADPAELLDVDVDQLARTFAFVALDGLLAEAAEACPSRSV